MNVIFFRKRNEFHTTNHSFFFLFKHNEPNPTRTIYIIFNFDNRFSVTYFAPSLVKLSIDH